MCKKKDGIAFNDIVGLVVAIWGLMLLTLNGPDWVYVGVIALGLTVLVGKKLVDMSVMPGMGGAKEEADEKVDG